MFGPNEMKAGDHITILVRTLEVDHHTKECGIGLVYEQEKEKEEEDALSYYKSWNNIIGGDLSAFQSTIGAYFLQNEDFMWYSALPFGYKNSLVDMFKENKAENRATFRAFSQKKSELSVG
ncbi:hypothetical protein QVD17_35298 [Tagetes erecta]|uniref:Uncharacterized protein n=1 Tax=Tagetes erecta TaxID=13708 RepID=A0AAD8NMF2_TARER|nr:hypothetical protein QVD17_35298 [Tagetes erecta]